MVVVCAESGADRQSVWKASDLAALCFQSKKDRTHTTKLRSSMKEIIEVHRQLWPGVEIPDEVQFDIDSKEVHFRSPFLPTSVMFSAVVHFAKHAKRSPDLRERAFQVLKRMIEQLCSLEGGLNLQIMVLKNNGRFSWKRVVLTDPHSEELWDMDHFKGFLEFAWAKDRNDLKKPWLQSHGRRPHVAEWLMFCTDVPARMRKQERSLSLVKVQLQAGVLSVLSEIAAQLDRKIVQVSNRISDFRQIARASDKLARWTAIGAAADKLWTGSAFQPHL